jgi:hypothetical protein
MRSLAFVAILALAGCSGSPPVDTSLDPPFAADDGKADAFSYRMKVIGDFAYGDVGDVLYHATKTVRFLAVRFAGHEGDTATAQVTSDDGAPIAWILDDKFRVLARSDDTSAMTITIPSGGDSVVHYVVMREQNLDDAIFHITLDGTVTFYWCDVDADCEKIDRNCCPDGKYIAVNPAEEEAYEASLSCPSPNTCDDRNPSDDPNSVPKCTPSGRCQLVEP